MLQKIRFVLLFGFFPNKGYDDARLALARRVGAKIDKLGVRCVRAQVAYETLRGAPPESTGWWATARYMLALGRRRRAYFKARDAFDNAQRVAEQWYRVHVVEQGPLITVYVH